MKKDLIIIGASGHGKVIADAAAKSLEFRSIRFLDDNIKNKKCLEYDVIGQVSDFESYIDDSTFIVAIGSNDVRKSIQNLLMSKNAKIATIVHPSAVVSSLIEIGIGSTVLANAVINCNVRVGSGCIINTGAIIEHDTVIEDYVHISPGCNIAGSVRIGEMTWIGIGSSVINSIYIPHNVTIGAGSLVIRDILEPGVYVGSPVRKLIKS